MIVDIALDDNGKQLYQVHESSKLIRKEMPRSTRFNNQPNLIDDESEEKTPIRKILGTISPSTLNQKKTNDDESPENTLLNEPESATRSNSVNQLGNYFLDAESLSMEPGSQGMLNEYHYSLHPGSASRVSTGDVHASAVDDSDLDNGGDPNKNNDIWSEDVEQAFEEVLSLIPKNGLNKIKISGRSCGRNELISDYILTKTGKFRTRKQVSSHIQVIKNLGQKHNIIKLINEGPSFSSEEELRENTKRFEEIFSKINLDKSLGFSETNKRKLLDINNTNSNKRSKKHPITKHSKSAEKSTTPPLDLSIENFYMSIFDNSFSNPIILTLQNSQALPMPQLRLKPNANISNRFPDLFNLINSNIPILHSLIKLQGPINMPVNYSIEQGLKTNLFLKDNNSTTASNGTVYSVFTVIYTYGKETFKINENNIKFNENLNFLTKFWKFYLTNELKTNNLENLNHLTIKQILYEGSKDDQDLNSSNASDVSGGFKLPKLKIKSIFLWEFLKVNDLKDALTTISKLIFPESNPPPSSATSSYRTHMANPSSSNVTSLTESLNANESHNQDSISASHEAGGSRIAPQVIDYPPAHNPMYYNPEINLTHPFNAASNVNTNVGLNQSLMTSSYSAVAPVESNYYNPAGTKSRSFGNRIDGAQDSTNDDAYDTRDSKYTTSATGNANPETISYNVKAEPGLEILVSGQQPQESADNEPVDSLVHGLSHLNQVGMHANMEYTPSHAHLLPPPALIHRTQLQVQPGSVPSQHTQIVMNPYMVSQPQQFQSMDYEYPFLYNDPNNVNYMNTN